MASPSGTRRAMVAAVASSLQRCSRSSAPISVGSFTSAAVPEVGLSVRMHRGFYERLAARGAQLQEHSAIFVVHFLVFAPGET